MLAIFTMLELAAAKPTDSLKCYENYQSSSRSRPVKEEGLFKYLQEFRLSVRIALAREKVAFSQSNFTKGEMKDVVPANLITSLQSFKFENAAESLQIISTCFQYLTAGFHFVEREIQKSIHGNHKLSREEYTSSNKLILDAIPSLRNIVGEIFSIFPLISENAHIQVKDSYYYTKKLTNIYDAEWSVYVTYQKMLDIISKSLDNNPYV